MKKIQITPQPPETHLTVGGNGAGINAPVSIGAVEVTHFEKAADGPNEQEREPQIDPVFQPGPAAASPMPAPVPPPEPTFEGYTKAALACRGSSMPFANFWASMAQATATAELAEQVGILNDFLGANDGPEDGEQLRLYEVIAAGIQEARVQAEKEGKKNAGEKKDKR